MQTLTVILNDVATATAVLQGARLLSTRMSCRIQAIHPRPTVDPDFMPTEEIMTPARENAFIARQEERSSSLARIFRDWTEGTQGGPSLEEIEGKLSEVLDIVLLESDLVAVGAACGTDRFDAGETIHHLLKQHRIPVLVVPPSVPTSVGARPGIAWKSGLQLDAAIASVGRLLQNTDQIHILSGDGSDVADDALRGFISELTVKGISVDVSTFDARGRHAGHALVEAARLADCDLLVMGTHTHGWLGDALFQGLSEKVLAENGIPVLLHA